MVKNSHGMMRNKLELAFPDLNRNQITEIMFYIIDGDLDTDRMIEVLKTPIYFPKELMQKQLSV